MNFVHDLGWYPVIRVLAQRLASIRLVIAAFCFVSSCALASSQYLSPTALAAAPDGKMLYIACHDAKSVLLYAPESRHTVSSISLPQPPTGIAITPDGKKLYVTCAAPESLVCVIDADKGSISGTISAGHTAMAPVLSPNGRELYVCNRFNNNVSIINLSTGNTLRRIPVQREPFAADVTKDGRYLLVANHLHTGRADVDYVAAIVSIIDLKKGKVIKELHLPNGSGSLNELRVSPDGKYAALTHIVGRFKNLPTHVNEGWINANALTLIDLSRQEIRNTVLLDDSFKGAANPWGIAWTSDSKNLAVTCAGTHEVILINFPALLAAEPPIRPDAYINPGVADDLPFFPSERTREKLPEGDLGPRSIVLIGKNAYTANYYSDSLTTIDFQQAYPNPISLPLTHPVTSDLVRKGDFYFHDAGICFQGWQSCASCHPDDARSDGLNWDLLNDGMGNPKNTKSLLFAPETPPSMWLGVRANSKVAVRAGIEHILFTVQPESVPSAIDAYLSSLMPIQSPYLVNGELSFAAKRGKEVFDSVGCTDCHEEPLLTDLDSHDVGTGSGVDSGKQFITPNLKELWRKSPYLHNGSVKALDGVVSLQHHARVPNLTKEMLKYIDQYLLSQ